MKARFLFLFLMLFIISCTKLTPGDTVSIILNSYTPSGSSKVINSADKFFTKASYYCVKSVKKDIDLRCKKEVKKFASLHTISEVIEISASPIAWNYIYMKQTRWDTGIIDTNLLTDAYHNKDIKEFCRYLDSKRIAACR